MLDITAGDRKYGVFDDIHGRKNGAKFADAIKEAVATNFGTGGPAFLERLIGDMPGHLDDVRHRIDAFRDLVLVQSGLSGETLIDGQVERAVGRFGLIAAAGELATLWGITGWKEGSATKAAQTVFRLWIRSRGGVGAAERREALERSRDFLLSFGSSRFEEKHCDRPIPNRAGWRDADYFYISSAAWKEMHNGSDATRAARFLHGAGFLKRGEGKHLTRKASFAPYARCYWVSVKILSAETSEA